MITCDSFRARFVPATDDPAVLAHLRACDACLNFAAEHDGDVIFRAAGGDDLVPPGGIDAFVDDVMRAVQIRSAESTVSSRGVTWPRKVALAATVAMAMAGAALMYERSHAPIVLPPVAQIAHDHVLKAAAPRPVIESYDSQKATIVEMPTDREDVKVVMVLDDSLPADL